LDIAAKGANPISQYPNNTISCYQAENDISLLWLDANLKTKKAFSRSSQFFPEQIDNGLPFSSTRIALPML
jgi:hypothetical protein